MTEEEVYKAFGLPPHIINQVKTIEVPEQLKETAIMIVDDQFINGSGRGKPIGLLESVKP